MMGAALRGDPDALRGSILDGASVSFVYPNTGWTSLLLAIEHDWPTLVAVILASGADPNLATRQGWTALHQAVDVACEGAAQRDLDHPDEAIVRLLLAAGGDPRQANHAGDTPADFARDYRWTAGLELFGSS